MNGGGGAGGSSYVISGSTVTANVQGSNSASDGSVSITFVGVEILDAEVADAGETPVLKLMSALELPLTLNSSNPQNRLLVQHLRHLCVDQHLCVGQGTADQLVHNRCQHLHPRAM